MTDAELRSLPRRMAPASLMLVPSTATERFHKDRLADSQPTTSIVASPATVFVERSRCS